MKLIATRQTLRLYERIREALSLTPEEMAVRMALAAAKEIETAYADRERPIHIFCGPTYAGAVGMALAAELNNIGYKALSVYFFNIGNQAPHTCIAEAARLQKETPEVAFTEISQQLATPALTSDSLIIDALFGAGDSIEPGPGYFALINFINTIGATVVSIDLPAGIGFEEQLTRLKVQPLHATETLTFATRKLAHLTAENAPFIGKVSCIGLGISLEDLQGFESPYSMTEAAEMAQALPLRPAFGHKGTFGHALLIAGRWGMAGAAILAARACLRSGAGKLTIHTPRRNNDILQTTVPEAILEHDEDETAFTTPLIPTEYAATAIGPGIGRDKKTAFALYEQICQTSGSLILDADALNILSEHRLWLSKVPHGSILTPHAEELRRLAEITSTRTATLFQAAVSMAAQLHSYVVLKGHYTAVCTPEGRVYFNPTGNAGMATAGTGDVLTGIILGLLAQTKNPLTACRIGTYLHGLAGDLAAADLTEYAVTAQSLTDYLPQAFQKLLALRRAEA